MTGVKFHDQTSELGKPDSMSNEECYSLPIKRTQVQVPGNAQYPSIESVWEMTDEELQQVIKSKRIRIGILSNTTIAPMYVVAESAQ